MRVDCCFFGLKDTVDFLDRVSGVFGFLGLGVFSFLLIIYD